jgi:pyruvate/2-oxoglutarate dehydrogenase complex dihydrolipoamide acyltransferase (E2) component
VIPPRTRKYLKDCGLLEQASQIPVRGSKMMPEDVDAFLASQQITAQPSTTSESQFDIVALPKSQIALNYRMSRGAGACIPVTVSTDIDWTSIQKLREEHSWNKTPSGFCLACWAAVQAMKVHEKFRSGLTAEGNSLKIYRQVHLGVAVALPGDEMVTAVVARANELSLEEFCQAYDRQVELARSEGDQADATTTLTMSNIGKVGMRLGIPAIVAPAVATLAIGVVTQVPVPAGDSFRFCPMASATLSFDHRVVNGAGAANFMNDFRKAVETIRRE